MHTLNLRFNRIDADGVQALAEALKVCVCFDLVRVQSTSHCTCSVAKDNRAFKALALGSNSLGEKGAVAIADALKVMCRDHSSTSQVTARNSVLCMFL